MTHRAIARTRLNWRAQLARAAVVLLAAVLVVGAAASAGALTRATEAAGVASPVVSSTITLTLGELVFLHSLNLERARVGLEPLSLHRGLRDVARARSADMARNRYFAHISPSGESAWTLVSHYAVSVGGVAETLARSGGYSVAAALGSVRSLMASPRHRSIILSPSLRIVGVGLAVDGERVSIFTAIYAR